MKGSKSNRKKGRDGDSSNSSNKSRPSKGSLKNQKKSRYLTNEEKLGKVFTKNINFETEENWEKILRKDKMMIEKELEIELLKMQIEDLKDNIQSSLKPKTDTTSESKMMNSSYKGALKGTNPPSRNATINNHHIPRGVVCKASVINNVNMNEDDKVEVGSSLTKDLHETIHHKSKNEGNHGLGYYEKTQEDCKEENTENEVDPVTDDPSSSKSSSSDDKSINKSSISDKDDGSSSSSSSNDTESSNTTDDEKMDTDSDSDDESSDKSNSSDSSNPSDSSDSLYSLYSSDSSDSSSSSESTKSSNTKDRKYKKKKAIRNKSKKEKKEIEERHKNHERLIKTNKRYRDRYMNLINKLKNDKKYMSTRKYKNCSYKSKQRLYRKYKKKSTGSKKKQKRMLHSKDAIKLKKRLSDGFKAASIKELNTTSHPEKKWRFFTYWINKIQSVCDVEGYTGMVFKNFDRTGKLKKIKSSSIDLALFNSLTPSLDHNTYKYLRHKYPSGIGLLEALITQCMGNRTEIRDELYSAFRHLTIGKTETATNFTSRVMSQANEVSQLGKRIKEKEICIRVLQGISSSHQTYGGLILLLKREKKSIINDIIEQISDFDRSNSILKKELAARVDIPNTNKDKAKKKTKYQGHCENCGFYEHELKNCYGKKKGLPAATPEEKIQIKLYCKICRKPGKHDTEDHKDEELAGMARI